MPLLYFCFVLLLLFTFSLKTFRKSTILYSLTKFSVPLEGVWNCDKFPLHKYVGEAEKPAQSSDVVPLEERSIFSRR